ncbi:hypothetical protein Sjap_010279 [Stephania japonica]|uniref:DYW domain-containing protein n=1 Tax=Stephania japonica TaxID=461633 RepID=A0AAP0J8S5_9MAGN
MEITTLPQALQLHSQIIKTGSRQKGSVVNLSKLLTFVALSSSGNLSYARQIFDSLPNPNSYFWNTMIRAYASTSDDPDTAFNLYLSMHINAAKPDKFTYPFLLKSCTRTRRIKEGKQLHAMIHKAGLQSDRFIQNSLIHLYSSCGDSSSAAQVFGKMSDPDVVSWTSIIDGYVDDKKPVMALQLFQQMQEHGTEPNEATLVSALKACADTGALSVGQEVHGIARLCKLDSMANVSTALLDMYAKCGCIDSARDVFHSIAKKDAFAWTAMISGLASHGLCKDAIKVFNQMQELNVRPDERTMTAVLSACRNAGRVKEAYAYFNQMERRYGVKPRIQHYGCMVDLLARAGHLSNAEQFIKRMPVEPDAILWRTLIWACKVHGDTDRAERLINNTQLLQKDSSDSGTYILLGNVYASAGKWQEKATIRDIMNKKGLAKPKGSSKIEVNGRIHEFVAGDTNHLESEKIHRKLDDVIQHLTLEGYQPKHSEVLLDIEDEGKAFQLQHHSEKLAVAFGLINASEGTTIRIVKNLRSCEDCHSMMKLISKVYEQEIIIRDRIRFHHFKDGNCSCGDHW